MKPKQKPAALLVIADALRKSGAVYTDAARLVRAATGRPCSVSTIKGYLERYPELKEIEQETREALLDIAESNLVRAIKSGETQPTLFYLKTKGKSRGYVERQEKTGANGSPIERRVTHEFKAADDEQLIGILEVLARAGALDDPAGEGEPGPPPGTTTH